MTTGHKVEGTFGQGERYFERYWSGEDDPAHKAWNNYSTTVHRYQRGTSTLYRLPAYTKMYDFHAYTPGVHFAEPLSAGDELLLQSRIVNRIRNNSFNAAVFLGELGQTRRLLSTTLSGLLGMLQGVKKRNPAMVATAFAAMTSGKKLSTICKSKVRARDISGTILATHYGWMPLLSDIFDAMNAMHSKLAGPRTMTYKTSVSGPRGFGTVVNPGSYGYNNPANKRFWHNQRRVGYIVEFYEKMSAPRALGLYNPASVLWELTPWSFVFDWFLPIGRYLDVLGMAPFLELRYMRLDKTWYWTYSWSGHAWVENPLYYAIGGHDFYRGDGVQYSRVVGTKLNVPFPSLNAVRKAFSLKHITDAAALVHQGVQKSYAFRH